MNKLREALAELVALEDYTDSSDRGIAAWANARAAIAEPAQPVPCLGKGDSRCDYLASCGRICNKCGREHDGQRTNFLRAAEPAQPLSDEQIGACMLAVDDPLLWGRLGDGSGNMVRQFARAIERAHGIGKDAP